MIRQSTQRTSSAAGVARPHSLLKERTVVNHSSLKRIESVPPSANCRRPVTFLVLICMLLCSGMVWGGREARQPEPKPALTALALNVVHEDLRVKAFGDDVVIYREFTDRQWKWNAQWSNVMLAKPGEGGGGYPELNPIRYQINRIERNDAKFVALNAITATEVSDLVFQVRGSPAFETFEVSPEDLTFTWRDKNNNWIEYLAPNYSDYGAGGFIHRYGNALYTNTIELDAQKRVHKVSDHFGKTLVTLNYLRDTNLPTQITDYSGRTVSYQYDEDDQLSVFTDVRGEEWKYPDPYGSLEDPLGNLTTHEYTSNGTFVNSADNLKTVYHYAYEYNNRGEQIVRDTETPDGTITRTIKDNTTRTGSTPKFQTFINGELVSQQFGDEKNYEIEDAHGLRTKYQRNQFGKLTSIAYPDNSRERWEYSADGVYNTAYTNRNGTTTEWDYDAKGRVTEERQAAGRPEQQTTRYSYPDLLTRITTYVGDGHTPDAIVTERFDEFGNVIEYTDAEGNTTNYTYNARGDLLTESFPNSADVAWQYSYDPAGHLLKETDPLGRETTYTYDAVGNLKTTTWPNLATTEYGYNALNERVTTTNAKNDTVRQSYDRTTRTLTFTDAKEASTRLKMDAQGMPTLVEDPNGNHIRGHYDKGRLKSVSYPTFEQRYGYTPDARLSEVTDLYDNKQAATSLDINPMGKVEALTDANNNPEQRQYNALGRLTRVTDARNGVTSLEYDSLGNLIRVEDPEGRETHFEYNRNGQVVAEERSPTSGELSRRSYRYDASGNLRTEVTPEGEMVVYSYNQADEVIRIEFFADEMVASPNQTITLSYNELGQIATYADGETTGTYTYTQLGQLQTQTINYGPFTKSIQYTYDAAGNLATYTNPEDVTYSYSYDGAGQIRSINIPSEGLISFGSYQWNQPTRISLPGGSVIERQFDGLQRMVGNQLKDPAQTALMVVAYGYDPVGNILSQSTEHGDYSYDYDDLYRLTGTGYPAGNDETFDYDGVGNRTAYNGDTSWTYNDANQLKARGNIDYTYNANGHLVRKTVAGEDTHFIYNTQERLVRVENHNRDVVARYGYNPFGHRMWKEVGGGLRTYFFYNSSGLVGEYSASGDLIREYQYTPGSTWMTDPVFQRVGGSLYFYQNDHLGTPQRMLAHSGELVWEGRAKAFGQMEEYRTIIENNLRFPGQYFDRETGLSHNYFRDYDSGSGRYIQSDPIGLAGGVNTYAYVDGSPLRFFDPFGLEQLLLFNDRDMIKPRFSYVPDKPGVLQIFGHSRTGDHIRDERGVRGHSRAPHLGPQELLDLAIEEGLYEPGMPIELYSCNTGKGEDSLAKKIHELTGDPVTAPDRWLSPYPLGNPTPVTRPPWPFNWVPIPFSSDGVWVRFE